jgi:hypothetical protein
MGQLSAAISSRERLAGGTALGSGFAAGLDAGVQEGGGAGGAGIRIVGPLPEAFEGLGVAERDGGLQPGAVLDFGKVHDGVD